MFDTTHYILVDKPNRIGVIKLLIQKICIESVNKNMSV